MKLTNYFKPQLLAVLIFLLAVGTCGQIALAREAKSLKVLAIGNSYSTDALEYL